VVSNISAAQRANSRLVDITYDVAADFPTVSVSLQVSSNGGSTFAVPATTLSGAIGAGVATGTAKKITWDAGKDWSGQYSTQMRFKVIADDGNSAPTISDIAAQTITAGNNTGALAFTVGDAQTAAGSLTVSGSSSNTTLVPNANIVFGGSGANRTVTVTPASSQTGTATITVTVSDGSLSASDTFVLTVNANAAPTISDIAAQSINEGSSTGTIAFTVGDTQTAVGSLNVSGSSSNTTLVPNANIVFGGSGASRTVTVTPASNQVGTVTITVMVNDGSLSISDTFVLNVNGGLALIPAGEFLMGESYEAAEPVHSVNIKDFYIGKFEVTKAEWDEVRLWAIANGYDDLAKGEGKSSNHPVHSVSWHDVLKWCNARSEKEGLRPVYYIDEGGIMIYKKGIVNITNNCWSHYSSGYRLPTEAEWEKAARGGLNRKKYPSGDTISHDQANVKYSAYHPSFKVGFFPYTSPVGFFAANGYGLYDMAGNVSEWCSDGWSDGYEVEWELGVNNYTTWRMRYDPRSSDKFNLYRIHRGGSWAQILSWVSYRFYNDPASSHHSIGFRVVRSSVP
jgi:formylglycine-generating enzyme required for sulfatase activity